MGILKSISEMGIGKLVILGVLWLVVGVPTLALLVTMVVSITGGGLIGDKTMVLIICLALGIPGCALFVAIFSLFVTMVICVICGPFALLGTPPWNWKGRKSDSPSQPSPLSRSRNLSFGIVLLTIGAGITASLYVIPKITGIEGIPMLFGTLILFGGLGLIISYLVVSRIEKRQKAE